MVMPDFCSWVWSVKGVHPMQWAYLERMDPDAARALEAEYARLESEKASRSPEPSEPV